MKRTKGYVIEMIFIILFILIVGVVLFLIFQPEDKEAIINKYYFVEIDLKEYEETINPIAEELNEPPILSSFDLEELTEELTFEEEVNVYVENICELYPLVEPSLVKSVIFHESSYRDYVYTYNKFVKDENKNRDVGLMQVSMYWHEDRAERLGVEDFFDPYNNILIGVDYLSELYEKYEDTNLVLMLYNMKHKTAFELYNNGIISDYAKSVVEMAEDLRKE